MKYLSDRELNKRIAERIYIGENSIRARKGMKASTVIVISNKLRHDIAMVDYCNNWNDLMPLVDFNYEMRKTESGLFHCTVLPDWHLGDVKIGTRRAVESKTRALAECLLKVLESKK